MKWKKKICISTTKFETIDEWNWKQKCQTLAESEWTEHGYHVHMEVKVPSLFLSLSCSVYVYITLVRAAKLTWSSFSYPILS